MVKDRRNAIVPAAVSNKGVMTWKRESRGGRESGAEQQRRAREGTGEKGEKEAEARKRRGKRGAVGALPLLCSSVFTFGKASNCVQSVPSTYIPRVCYQAQDPLI